MSKNRQKLEIHLAVGTREPFALETGSELPDRGEIRTYSSSKRALS